MVEVTCEFQNGLWLATRVFGEENPCPNKVQVPGAELLLGGACILGIFMPTYSYPPID